ncbi:DUF4920 domain-containing protein [Pontibacter anaerobius]|uniref:DUF4920 domain-containing protein n=1 Tax=Pontibacter anaerobius TaxID=2993940 RepID=A0ABT3RKA3_9BACT|nr:DUF4920 domain-containing protein [Pontibacter anaerobius]MCX2741804.1 DUF4920 domain-containing protein [Pontibacter anaerobius]
MKKIFYSVVMAAALYGCNQSQQAAETTPDTVASAKGTSFGASFAEENVMAGNQLAAAAAGKDSVQATVSAVIVESCQSKGCWMDVKLAESSSMKVTFRDYGFFVPTENLAGREVIFTGTAKREVVSVEDQRHYAKDAGKTETEIAAITEPKEELRFVADGVILK